MTCIVGIEHPAGVTVGADSAATSGSNISIGDTIDHKVFIRGAYIFGFTWSYRMGQLLRYTVDLPEPPARSQLDRFMVTAFVDYIREGFEQAGWLKTKEGREEQGQFFVGVRGRLYCVQSDWHVGRPAARYEAIGSGGNVAIGSLHTTASLHLPPDTRARWALQAAAAFTSTVAAPFRVRTLPADAVHRTGA